MRSVAQAVGVAPMSIYTYVPGKAELLDLMLDTVPISRCHADRSAADSGTPGLTMVADENRAMYQAHPWMATVATARPTLGPGMMAKYDHELSAFGGMGLDDVTVDDALTYLLTFVQATARAAIESRTAVVESAMNDAGWWAANASLLARVFDPQAYPTAARIGTAAGQAHGTAYDPDHAYTFGLARTLDAIGVLM